MMSQINLHTAFQYLVEKMGESPRIFEGYGYDLYLPKSMRKFAGEVEKLQHNESERRAMELSPYFYEAAFELVKKGVIRYGITKHNEQHTQDGSAGNGYSLTTFGESWLTDNQHRHFVPTEPEKFADLLASFNQKFGEGFHQRAQEALKCYRFGAYLACCAMCGAATESILLALAIKKTSDEEEVLKKYKASSGRKKIFDDLIGQKDKRVQSEFSSCANLLNYWRDESAHGTTSTIEENEAFTSLALLLRFAQFSSENWQDLTT